MRSLSILLVLIFSFQLFAQENVELDSLLSKAPKLYIDQNRVSMDYLREKVNFVNYVRDRKLSDIYILVTTQPNAHGGREYTFTFEGKNEFDGMNDTLVYHSQSYSNDSEVRKEFVKKIKQGLLRFMVETPILDKLKIGFDYQREPENVTDSWNYWVFKIRTRGGLRGEELRESYYLSADLDIDRITEDWKFRFESDVDYDEDSYKINDDSTWTTNSKSWEIEPILVKSISDQWSVGLFGRIYSSTYRNMKTSFRLVPGIEYNIFPYSESTYREIRLAYYIGPNFNHYREETIFDKSEETLFTHGIIVDVEIKQPWGQIDIRGEYTNYLNDFSKRRFELFGNMSFQLVKGLSFDLGGGYSMVHDQIGLPKRDLNIEEIILRRTELATQYSFSTYFGISYTFGAIYNNIVNPRFGF